MTSILCNQFAENHTQRRVRLYCTEFGHENEQRKYEAVVSTLYLHSYNVAFATTTGGNRSQRKGNPTLVNNANTRYLQQQDNLTCSKSVCNTCFLFESYTR